MKLNELSTQLIAYFPKDPLEKYLLLNILYWLAEGNSLSLEHISRRLGYSREKVEELLKKIPGVELSNTGNIIAVAGLSLHETAYPINRESCRIYAQSGLDAIVIPTLLLTKIDIEYQCPDDPISVHLRFGFDQAFSVQPDLAMVSFPSRTNLLSHLQKDRSEFKLFPNHTSAKRWLLQHPDGTILLVKNVFASAASMRRSLIDSNAWMLRLLQ